VTIEDRQLDAEDFAAAYQLVEQLDEERRTVECRLIAAQRTMNTYAKALLDTVGASIPRRIFTVSNNRVVVVKHDGGVEMYNLEPTK
jgi:hypothetical protein